MATNSDDAVAAKERLSALVDGELDQAGVSRACAAWREDASLRASWHTYHLIGDVLRSDDLCSDAACDVAFVQALRARLADEPLVFAPQPAPAAAPSGFAPVASGDARRRHWQWMAPSAVAAGFVAVAGVVTLMRAQAPMPPSSSSLAQASPANVAVQRVAADAASAAASDLGTDASTVVASGKLIRDAQLDRYLAAHKQFAGSSALGVPSAFLRSATSDASNR